MLPNQYLKTFISAVVERSGICRPTVEAVLPAVFDEIRYQLTEGTLCVPIESFGTFAVVEIPERQRHYTYGGVDEMRTLPAKLKIKFSPSRNFKREVDDEQFDSSRKSFRRHPDDPAIRMRSQMLYNKRSQVYLQTVKQDDRGKRVIAFEPKPKRIRKRRNTEPVIINQETTATAPTPAQELPSSSN